MESDTEQQEPQPGRFSDKSIRAAFGWSAEDLISFKNALVEEFKAREWVLNEANTVNFKTSANKDEADDLARHIIEEWADRFGGDHGMSTETLKRLTIQVLREKKNHDATEQRERQRVQAGKRKVRDAIPKDSPARKKRKNATGEGPQQSSKRSDTKSPETQGDRPDNKTPEEAQQDQMGEFKHVVSEIIDQAIDEAFAKHRQRSPPAETSAAILDQVDKFKHVIRNEINEGFANQRGKSPPAETWSAKLNESTLDDLTKIINTQATLKAEELNRCMEEHVERLSERMNDAVVQAVKTETAKVFDQVVKLQLAQISTETEVKRMLSHQNFDGYVPLRHINIELRYHDRPAESVWLGALRPLSCASPVYIQEIKMQNLRGWIANQRDEKEFFGRLMYTDPKDGEMVNIVDDDGLRMAVVLFQKANKDIVLKVSEDENAMDA